MQVRRGDFGAHRAFAPNACLVHHTYLYTDSRNTLNVCLLCPLLTVERRWKLLCAEPIYRGVVEGWQVCPRVRARLKVCRISYLKALARGRDGVGSEKEVLIVLATRKCFPAARSPETPPPCPNLRER